MFKNYGDKNFFEHGRLVDGEHSDNEIRVLYCEPFCDAEDLYLYADCTVNIGDKWIDWGGVKSFAALHPDDSPEEWAVAAVEYHGVENFSSPYDGYQFTKEEIKEKLKYHLIAHDEVTI